MSLAQLKNITANLDKMLELEEAIALSAYARRLEDEYGHLELDTPAWLETAQSNLRAEIEKRTHASDLAKMRELEAELEGYKTVGEKRTEATRRLAELQEKLGYNKKATASRR